MPGVPTPVWKPCDSRRRPDAALGLTDCIITPHEAEPQVVHGGRAEGFRVAQSDQLSPAVIESVEAGNAGAALSGRIRVVESEIVDEIICRKGSPAIAVAVEAEAAFVVCDQSAPRCRSKKTPDRNSGVGMY